MRAVGSDLRLAARNLARRPGFTATAIATLALGVGANSLDFTWAKAIVLRPLPGVERPGEIVVVSGASGERRGLAHAPANLDFYRAAERRALADLAG